MTSTGVDATPWLAESASAASRSLSRAGRPVIGGLLFGIGCAAVWVYGRTTLELVGGMTGTASATAWMALGAGGAGAVLASPWLTRHPLSTTWPATVLGTAAATALIGAAPDNRVLACAAAALFGLAYTAATSVLILWASAIAGSGVANTSVLFVALVLGQAAGAALTGWLIGSAGTLAAFSCAALACVASTAVALGVRTTTTADPAPRHG